MKKLLLILIIVFLIGCAHTQNIPADCLDPADCPQLDPGFYDELKKAALSIPLGIGIWFLVILLI